MILGYDAIVGEKELGSLELLLSMPITRFEILLGKYFGLSAALASATVIGFGAGLLPMAAQLNSHDLYQLRRLCVFGGPVGNGVPQPVAVAVGGRDRSHACQRHGDRDVVFFRADF